MSLLYLLGGVLVIGIIVAGLWVDYQCNWKKSPELRGFDVVLPTRVDSIDPHDEHL